MTESPWQKVVGPSGVIVATGFGVTVTFTEAELEQLLLFDTVTEYVPEVVAVMLCVVAPVDHKYVDPLLAVRITESPWQNVVGPSGVIVATGFGVTVTLMEAEPVQPFALVTITEYVPDVFAVMFCVVAPVDHTYD